MRGTAQQGLSEYWVCWVEGGKRGRSAQDLQVEELRFWPDGAGETWRILYGGGIGPSLGFKKVL
jgi:hypothetical protein